VLVSNMSTTTELYNTLNEMGILCTEERRIRENREYIGQKSIEQCSLSYRDIERVGYFYPHFMIDRQPIEDLEIWIDDEYINPNTITWIESEVHLYGIMPKHYDIENTVVTLIRNENIFQRYTKIADVEGDYIHVQRIDITRQPFASMDNPGKCVYYISNGKICIPEVKQIDATHWEFHCSYTTDIDLFLCANLAGVYEVKANTGIFIDSPYHTRCYHHIVVDHDPGYPIDAKFYPCIKVDKDCIVRVYTDSSDRIPCPDVSRLVCYPEFMMIDDPYNCDVEYLNKLRPVNDVILGSDDEEIILDKLFRIAAYCYRLWEKFPFFCSEQNDFLMCDNSRFARPTFFQTDIHMLNGKTKSAIVTNVPFEPHRDIMFYCGNIFSDYQVVSLKKIDDHYVENLELGNPTYIIDSEMYDVNRFTLIKFNAGEDTVIENIGDYVDLNNILELHTKLNRFYRNLLILRGDVIDHPVDDAVRVATVEPSVKDQHLWFELLVNVEPDMFQVNPIERIKAMGLDPDNIPQDIKAGSYAMDMIIDDTGPQEYTELLLTYFKLSKGHKDYLVLQEGSGIDDPRIVERTEMNIGPLPESPELNAVSIEDNTLPEREGFEQYESGIGPPPDSWHYEGQIYAETFDVDGKDNPDTPYIDENPFDNVLNGVGVVAPDMFALETISYVDDESGNYITGAEIAGYTVEQKKRIILRYITEGTEEDKTAIRILWESYLDTMDKETLNVAVYKVLLIDYVYSNAANEIENPYPELDNVDMETDGAEYILSEEKPENAEIGMYWLDIPPDPEDAAPVIQTAKMNNLKYIMSIREPDFAEIGTIWVNIPGVTLQDYVGEIVCSPLMENGYNLPEGFLMDLGEGDVKSTLTFDYGAHGDETEIELFRKVDDPTLYKINYGKQFSEDPTDRAIWYEFLEEIDNKVCYSDTESMILNINERLLMLQFDHDNITAFMFDDIVMNFRGKLGIRYISILADLISSGVIDLKDVNIFHKRLVTGEDVFDPGLMRLYTGRSHTVSTARIDTTDYSVTYSTNIGRYHIDYDDEEGVTNREREAAWRHVIDYSYRDIAFLGDRMMLFVNGRYIPRTEYKEIAAGKIQLLNFNEIISCVDFFYSKKDIYLSRAKRLAIQYWNAPDTSTSIQRPDRDYEKMIPMHVCDKTYRGFYDVLMEEYIYNGRLMRELKYLEDHQDEAEYFIRDLVRKFNAISDISLTGMPDNQSRIIIPGLGSDQTYTIKE